MASSFRSRSGDIGQPIGCPSSTTIHSAVDQFCGQPNTMTSQRLVSCGTSRFDAATRASSGTVASTERAASTRAGVRQSSVEKSCPNAKPGSRARVTVRLTGSAARAIQRGTVPRQPRAFTRTSTKAAKTIGISTAL